MFDARALVSFCFSLLFACSSAPTTAPAPSSCNRADRAGTYRLTWTEQSGTCGPVPSSLVSLNASDTRATAGCTLHSDVWSENDCKNERTFTCVQQVNDPAQWGGKGSLTTDSVAVTRQQTANGSHIVGTISVRLSATSGDSCNGTYGVDYQRQ